jgi:DMSO/TMAO reductase YedYZ molybdopterin-dependent catalytic subunit
MNKPQTSPDFAARTPPGQRVVPNLPVLDLGIQPDIATATWTLKLAGAIEHPQKLNWQTFMQLPQREIIADIHCVTHWTRFDVKWQGVAAKDIVALARLKSEVKFVVLHSADGYTTNVPLEVLLDDDVVFAHQLDGEALSREHGGPVRVVVPKRYFWKSAKWVTAIHFHAEDQPGYWEVRGYHNDADPFQEQRYSS